MADLKTQLCPHCKQMKFYDISRFQCSDCEDKEDDARERRGRIHRERMLEAKS